MHIPYETIFNPCFIDFVFPLFFYDASAFFRSQIGHYFMSAVQSWTLEQGTPMFIIFFVLPIQLPQFSELSFGQCTIVNRIFLVIIISLVWSSHIYISLFLYIYVSVQTGFQSLNQRAPMFSIHLLRLICSVPQLGYHILVHKGPYSLCLYIWTMCYSFFLNCWVCKRGKEDTKRGKGEVMAWVSSSQLSTYMQFTHGRGCHLSLIYVCNVQWTYTHKNAILHLGTCHAISKFWKG